MADDTQEPDFDALVDAAYERGSGEMKGMDPLNRLWAAFFQLEEWRFLVNPQLEAEPSPYLQRDDGGRSWALVFTDGQRMRDYAEERGYLDERGHALGISMQRGDAYQWLMEMAGRGLHGLRINEGEFGFFAPVANLQPIYEHLQAGGYL